MKNIKTIGILIIGMIMGSFIGIKAANLIESSQVIYKDNQTVDIALNNLFDELKLGKDEIAQAITNKGVNTTSNNTLSEMATNINLIENNGSYLRLNEETGYVQGLDTDGNWINLAYVNALPIEKIIYILNYSFATSSFSPVSYATKGTNCSIVMSGTKLTGNVYHSSDTNYVLDGYVPLSDYFNANGQPLTLTTTRTTSGSFESGPSTYIYLQSEDGANTSLGTIASGTYTYKVPNDGNNYKILFRIYGKGYGTGSGYSYINLTINSLILEY